MSGRIKTYYQLTKPGIIYGNTLTTAGGFLLASCTFGFNAWLMVATLVGTAFVMAASCVVNNYIDREIDRKMARTKKRALVIGSVSVTAALLYASVLAVIGFVLLALFTNMLTVLLGVIAAATYIVFYGIAKRRSIHGTLVGSVAGALPPVAGYTAASNTFDAAAVIIFFVLVFWQMPHFYAIAMYRMKDYAAAGIPVLPIKWGMQATKIQIITYTVAFLVAVSMLTVYGYTGYTYLIVMLGLGCIWLFKQLKGFRTSDDVQWARSIFFFSLLVLMAFSVMLAVGALLP